MPSPAGYLLIATLFLAAAWNAAGQKSVGARPIPAATPIAVLPGPPDLTERCKTLFTETRQRIEDALKAKGLPPLIDADGPAEIQSDDTDHYGYRIVKVASGTKFTVYLCIGPPPGCEPEVISVSRPLPSGTSSHYSVKRMAPPGVTVTSTPPPAPPTREETENAVQLARFWCETVLGSFPAKTGELHTRRGSNGRWSVQWDRVDSLGYPFAGDAWMCSMGENYGIINVIKATRSVYAEKQKVVITNYDATGTAREAARKIMSMLQADVRKRSSTTSSLPGSSGLVSWFNWEDWRDWWRNMAASFRSYSINVTEKPRLLIVNPNHLLNLPVSSMMNLPFGDKEARLAWSVMIRVDLSTGSGSAPDVIYMQLWIDTETGECIGGNILPR